MFTFRKKIIINIAGSAMSLLAPMLLYPLLARVLSVDDFGIYFFGLSVVSLYVSISELGFNVSLSNEIVQSNNVPKIVSDAIYLKIGICGVLVLLFFAILTFLSNIETYLLIAYLAFAIGCALSPSWYFIGTGRLEQYSFINGLCRLIGTGVIYLIPNEFITPLSVMVCLACLATCADLVFFFIINKRERIKLTPPVYSDLMLLMKRTFKISIATLFVCAYTSLNPILLAAIGGYTELAKYSSVDKIYKSIEAAVASLMSMYYPKIVSD